MSGLICDRTLCNMSVFWWELTNVGPVFCGLVVYRIAENFQARKCSWISWFESQPGKFSPRNLGVPCPPMLGFSILQKFSPRNGHSHWSAKVFSLESFPLYVSRKHMPLDGLLWAQSIGMAMATHKTYHLWCFWAIPWICYAYQLLRCLDLKIRWFLCPRQWQWQKRLFYPLHMWMG